MSAAAAQTQPPLSELPRITSLPRRPVLDCERDAERRWSPEAQALVEVMTAKYSRGPRLSCGCQKRTLQLGHGGALTIFRDGKGSGPPPAPIVTTLDAFLLDNAHDPQVCQTVHEQLRPGLPLELKGLGARFCMTELNSVQAWIMYELPRAGGVFGLVSTGGGKTFSGILASLAMWPQVKSAILLAKPDQRVHYRNAYLRLREHFRVPTMIFDHQGLNGLIVGGDHVPTLRFIPYSQLSNPKSTELLESYEPDMIIADESHLLSAKSSSRTMRFLRYMAAQSESQKKNIVFCNWSGSQVKKSLKDCSHLAMHSLGLGSPYPIWPHEVDNWSAVIDPIVLPDTNSDVAQKLYETFGGVSKPGLSKEDAKFLMPLNQTQLLREGFRERVVETLGVISTRSASVTSSITIHERKPEKIPHEIKDALMHVRQDEVRPDGEVLVEALDVVMCAREVASGFYSYWAFIHGEPKELIAEWYATRKAFSKALRAKLILGEPHMDSPKLCINAAERAWQEPRYKGDLPVWPEETWPAWERVKDLVKPDPRVKWIDDYLARDAAAWATENVGIVWCQSRAFGKKAAQLAGINYHGGGPDAEAKILAENGKKSIVVSIDAHGTGRDGLQDHFYKQLVAEPPSSADRWQQLLARLCRPGQEAETIETWVYAHTSEIADALRKALMLAEYIEATTPNQQLLLAADFTFDL